MRSATKAELRRSIRDPEAVFRGGTGTGGAVSAQLEAIAQCESGGDPTAIGGGGLYRGKYQFSGRAPGSPVGGTGDPAAAPEAEQDRRAAALLARERSRPVAGLRSVRRMARKSC